MKRILLHSLAAFSVLLLTNSCVVLEKDFIAVQDELKLVTKDLHSSREELSAEKAKVAALQQQLADCQASKAELQTSLNTSISTAGQNSARMQTLIDQINESNQYIRNLQVTKSKADSLTLVLTNEVTQALSKEEIHEVDIQAAKTDLLLSISDNLLYNIGSNEISEKGAEALRHIAAVIKNYPAYDIIVEGNTSNMPVAEEAAVRHNWDLSAIRAASVVKFLQDDCGMEPQRMSASGRAEYNPVASNDSPFGQRRNLRTVIIVRPKTNAVLDLIK